MKNVNTAIIPGTRFEIIKMSPVIHESGQAGLDYFILHTGQHDLWDISSVLRPLDNGADMVIGSRFLKGNRTSSGIPAYRKEGMKVLDLTTHFSGGIKFSDA